jgi:dUTP pyrophosphatase
MTSQHELTDERMQEMIDLNCCMPCNYLDRRNDVEIKFEPTGVLYVCQPVPNVPFYDLKPAKPGDVGHDIPSRIKFMKDLDPTVRVMPYRDYYINFEEGWVDIPAHGYAEIPSALCVKVPWDSWGLIKTRSSTGWRKKLIVFEGVIDSAYLGQLCCLVHNPHQEPMRINDGERLSQLILVPKYPLKEIVNVSYLPKTYRGISGFGSSGS